MRQGGDVSQAIGATQGTQESHLLGAAPRTLVEEFHKIKSGDVVLPTRTADGRPGKTIRVRCVTTPDKAQKVMLSRETQ